MPGDGDSSKSQRADLSHSGNGGSPIGQVQPSSRSTSEAVRALEQACVALSSIFTDRILRCKGEFREDFRDSLSEHLTALNDLVEMVEKARPHSGDFAAEVAKVGKLLVEIADKIRLSIKDGQAILGKDASQWDDKVGKWIQQMQGNLERWRKEIEKTYSDARRSLVVTEPEVTSAENKALHTGNRR